MPSRLKTLMVLALPMVLARASQSVITFADAIQVSDLGDKAIAATASGGLNVMAWSALAMGTVFIVQSFVAQLAGRGQREDASRFAWYGLGIAVAAGLRLGRRDPRHRARTGDHGVLAGRATRDGRVHGHPPALCHGDRRS